MPHMVTKGLDLDFIQGLSESQKSALAEAMARAAEKSYRRGFQQGATIGGDQGDLHDWRYGRALTVSPAPDRKGFAQSARDLLFLENQDLARIFLA